MSSAEISEFYEREVAGMAPVDQLLLANQILERVAQGQQDPFAGADSAAIVAQQKAALMRACGMFHGSPSDASVRHDDILYGELEK